MTTFGSLVERAQALATGPRRVLGIVGPPGSGKSTVACAVVQALGDAAVLVPMDGFHLAGSELARLDRHSRKGAPDTFDVDGYVALLHRLRGSADPVVYAPRFERAIEEPVANAIPVPRDVPLVVTEGNYLLLPDLGWGRVRPLLDDAWYVSVDDDVRRRQLVARHVRFGKSPEQAAQWVRRSDERNAELVARTAAAADLVVDVAELAAGGWLPDLST